MPTQRQKALAKKIIENPGLTMKDAMLSVGYAENTAVAPSQNITSTAGWQELMDKYLPDDKILGVHKSALDATKVISAKIIGKEANSQTDDFIEVPDVPTQLRAVELAYKVKRKTTEAPLIPPNQGNTIVFVNFKK